MSTVEGLRATGAIKWYNKEKGYGFIQMPGGGRDVFVHANQLRKSGIENGVNEGEKVTFNIDNGNRGEFATNIKKV